MLWNVQCILAAHASLRLACLLLLFNRFFPRQWIFLLRFRFLQFRLIELLNLSHIGLSDMVAEGTERTASE